MAPTLGLTVYQADKVDHGYTLLAPMTGTSAYLIDMQGRVVHYWSFPTATRQASQGCGDIPAVQKRMPG